MLGKCLENLGCTGFARSTPAELLHQLQAELDQDALRDSRGGSRRRTCEIRDVESTIDLATGLIQVGWPGGTLTLRYTGIPKVNKEAQEDIGATHT